jgi:outer membrane immunogenic protein
MKKLAFALASATVLISVPALAADLGRPVYKAPAYVAPPVTYWNGFYIGGQVGGEFGSVNQREFVTGGGPATGFSQSWSPGGVVGGGHVGYNFQTGALVLGVEGDFEGSGVTGNAPGLAGSAGGGGLGVGTAFDSRWDASLRGRLGYAAGNALLYVTGGGAWTDVRTRYFVPGAASLPGDTFTGTLSGWTVGAGAEWMFAPAWSARLEYRFTDYGRFTDIAPASFPGFDYRNHYETNAVRLGVSYHFGGGPVVANY